MLTGWQRAGRMPSRVVVSDPDSAARARIGGLSPSVVTVADNREAAGQEVVFLAVHPPQAKEVLPELAPHLGRERAILVSLLPKLTMERLQAMLGGFDRIARLIPNAASAVGRGYNPIAFAEALSEDHRAALRDLLAPLGALPEVEEAALEAYAIVTAMGPTYFWPQLYRLKALAESFGLTPEAAMEGIDGMMRGALAIMAEPGWTPEEVRDLVPVKPLEEDVETLCRNMNAKLSGLMDKLRP
jgi:pyrroline-5-carboxylate reductase